TRRRRPGAGQQRSARNRRIPAPPGHRMWSTRPGAEPLKKPCTGRGISWALLLSHLARSVPDQAMGGGDIGRYGTVMSGQDGRALAVTGEEDLAPADPTVPSGFEGTRAVPVASE